MRTVAERTAYGVAVGLEAVRGQHQLDLRAPLPGHLPQREVEHLGPLGRQQRADRRQPDVAYAGARGERRAPGQRGVVVEGGAAHGEAVLLAAQRVVEVDRRRRARRRAAGADRRARPRSPRGTPGHRQREQVGGGRVGRSRRTPWNARAAATTSSVTGPRPEPATSRARSTTGWSQSLRKPIGLKTSSSTGSGPGSVTTVGARSMTWCSATSPAAAGDDDVGRHVALRVTGVRRRRRSSTRRASRPGAAGRPAYDTTRPPWVVSPRAGGLAGHLHHDELRAGAGRRTGRR